MRVIVDVSSNNGTPDFRDLKRQGVIGVYIKATEGTSYVNPLFREQWAAASRAGLRCGAYHFARQDINPAASGSLERLPLGAGYMGAGLRALENGGRIESRVAAAIIPPLPGEQMPVVLSSGGVRAEAQHFVATMRTLPGHSHQAMLAGDLRPVLDFEVGTSDHRYSPWRNAFQRDVYEATRRRTILYTYTGFNDWAAPVPGFEQLWLANYGSHPTLPGGYHAWDLWQYTDRLHVAGISIDASKLPARPFPLRRILCKGHGT